MNKQKIFGYVEDERNTFMNDVKNRLVSKGYIRASKSKLIELALLELESNNDFRSIERKLLSKKMI